MTCVAIYPGGWAVPSSSALASQFVRRSAAPRTRIEASSLLSRQFHVDLADGRLDIEVSGEEPDWLYKIVDSLQELSYLPEGWDSYGGRPVTFEAAYRSLELLALCLPPNGVSPSLVPGSNGGIQLEWHRRAGDLEIMVSPDGQISVSYSNDAGDHTWEMELDQANIAYVKSTIENVSRR